MAFVSDASDLILRDTNGHQDVCTLRNLASGVTRRVSVSSSGDQARDSSFRLSISADGNYVVYGSAASNLVSGDTNRIYDVSSGIAEQAQPTQSTSKLNTGGETVKSKWNVPTSLEADPWLTSTS